MNSIHHPLSRNLLLVLLCGLLGSARAAIVQVEQGNTIAYSLAGSSSFTWALPTATWNYDGQLLRQFATTTYSYNDNYYNIWQHLDPKDAEATGTGVGGVVWHFQAATPAELNLAINFSFYTGNNWLTHVTAVYFSDNNTWADLKTMTGGTIETPYETANANWTKLYGLVNTDGSGGNYSKTATTHDGDFWVRIDFAESAALSTTTVLTALSVNGTAIPEPAMALCLGLGGGLICLRRRR